MANKTVDLGCGNVKRGQGEIIGIDMSKDSVADIICNLGFEKIPLPDNYADLVIAHHFLEHLPFVVWYKEEEVWKRHLPVIFLFREIWRILKPDGLFEVTVPCYPNRVCFQDPTHQSFWTDETLNYFVGDKYGLGKIYGIDFNFEKVAQNLLPDGWQLKFILKAKK